ncbi:uncharacterized protein PpBr36_09900 [Pyricularia pennisetigena]|nr:uncharacterized protein PpBr36_09900 [Pyricularia pennisetigena]TLS22463.1 hypothetical protein PpBr36_09900 [Pyricularia pennisetigena]
MLMKPIGLSATTNSFPMINPPRNKSASFMILQTRWTYAKEIPAGQY